MKEVWKNRVLAAALIALLASISLTNAIADTEYFGSEFNITTPSTPSTGNDTEYFGSELTILSSTSSNGSILYFGTEFVIESSDNGGGWFTDDNTMLFWYFIIILVVVFIIAMIAMAAVAKRR